MKCDYDALRAHLKAAHDVAHDTTMPDDELKAHGVSGHMVAAHKAMGELSPFHGDGDGDEDDMKAHRSQFRDEVLALSGASDEAKALGALTALRAKAEQVEALTARVAELEAERSAAEVRGLLDEAVKRSGKSAKRDEWETKAKKFGIDWLRALIEELPKRPEPALPPSDDKHVNAVALSGLSQTELDIIKNTGLTPEQFLEHRKAYKAQFANRGLRILNSEEQ